MTRPSASRYTRPSNPRAVSGQFAPRKYPIVMWHGAGQFSKTWETTSDGRDGFQSIFLRRNFSTYLIDQPRRGDAGRSMVEMTIKPTPDEQLWFNQFRVGLWPNCFRMCSSRAIPTR